MGLDTSHNCWHGPYGAFHRFRKELGNQIGIDIEQYAQYNKAATLDLRDIEHDIIPLLNHSDCDGELTVEESAQIVAGLNAILKNKKESPGADTYFWDNIIKFRAGCLEAISKNEVIEFR